MQGQKPSGQKISGVVSDATLPHIDMRWNPRPATDKSDHFEAKCPACGATSYVRDESGVLSAEEVRKRLKEKKPFTRVCGVCKVRINL